MLKIRFFEQHAGQKYLNGEIPGFLHSYAGQEAVAAGFCSALNKTDYITSTHRGHGHMIAKGADVKKMMAEIYGKANGLCKGKGGSMHIADFNSRIIGAIGIVGGGIPISNGIGLSIKMRNANDVVVCFFGDGASNQGSFHEALNLGSIWNLPVIYVCENNLYALSTPQKHHQNIKDISIRKKSYGIYGKTINGNNVLEVFNEAEKVVNIAREGKGPCIIECKTYRKYGHYIGDPGLYIDKEERKLWDKLDPILNYKIYLSDNKILNEDKLNSIEKEVEKEIIDAEEYAKNASYPEPEDSLKDLYVGELETQCL